MVFVSVSEAVSEFNERSVYGRIVVNPPEQRKSPYIIPTNETWHLCYCGRAFMTLAKYKEHRQEHKTSKFTPTWKEESYKCNQSNNSNRSRNSITTNNNGNSSNSNNSGNNRRASALVKNKSLQASNSVQSTTRYSRANTPKSQYTAKKLGSTTTNSSIASKTPKFDCQQCSLHFTNLHGLYQHLKWNHERTLDYPCFMCPLICSSDIELQKHFLQHTVKAVYEKCKKAGMPKTKVRTK